MLNRTEKEAIVTRIRGNIDKSQAIFLTNLVGIASNDANSIRKGVRDTNGTIVITRNTLIERAAKGTSAEGLLSNLKGTNAVAFAYEDAPATAKVLYDAGKELELVTLNAGLLDGKELSKEEVAALAKLPSRDQMLATLLATFQAPVSAFARVLNAIKDKKEEGADAPAVEAAPAEETTAE